MSSTTWSLARQGQLPARAGSQSTMRQLRAAAPSRTRSASSLACRAGERGWRLLQLACHLAHVLHSP